MIDYVIIRSISEFKRVEYPSSRPRDLESLEEWALGQQTDFKSGIEKKPYTQDVSTTEARSTPVEELHSLLRSMSTIWGDPFGTAAQLWLTVVVRCYPIDA